MHAASPGRLLILFALLLPGCGHELVPGHYALTHGPEDVALDTCGLLSGDGALPSATVTVIGEQVRVSLELFGPENPIRMLGRFKDPPLLFTEAAPGDVDAFTAHGSVVDARIAPAGVECVVPFGQVGIEAVVAPGNDAFDGMLTVHHELERNQDPRCPLTCDLRVRYTAKRVK